MKKTTRSIVVNVIVVSDLVIYRIQFYIGVQYIDFVDIFC